MSNQVVIIGGGQAAFSCTAKLRSLDPVRPIVMICGEETLPYQRPPLSKKYLLGEMSLDRIQLRAPEWYPDNKIDVRKGLRAVSVDRSSKTVSLSDGSLVSYDTLVFATGSTPRPLPAAIGGNLQNVFVVRDLSDADRLAKEMTTGKKLLIIGGGYIGLEAAAVARKLGLEVTLIEMADRILQRVASSTTADIIREIHESHGVRVLEKTGLMTLSGSNGKAAQATLTNGETLDVDLVIAGIGATANDEIAKSCGLDVANGIVVDKHARTSDPNIFAAGDCASLEWNGSRIRLESVQNAVDQAEAVAATIAGGLDEYDPKPWFWSDQYDVKLQIAGFNLGFDETLLRAGGKEGAFSVWYFQKGNFIAVDAINDARAYLTGKKLLDIGVNPDRAVLSDPNADLKQLLG